MQARPTVFISYSHVDEVWKNRLQRYLGVLEHTRRVSIWDDSRIDAGAHWYKELKQAMDCARVAICMISQDYLDSDFCKKEEIPYLLKRSAEDGMILIPVLLHHCEWPGVPWLSKIQMLPGRGMSIAEDFGDNWDVIFAETAERTVDIIDNPDYQLPEPPILQWDLPEMIDIDRLPPTGLELFGRQKEMEMLDEEWGSGKTKIVSLVAWGGVGKSTLINRWLESMAEDNYRGARRVYGWSFYSQGTGERVTSADQFIAETLTWFGDPDMAKSSESPWAKGRRLAELVREEKTLLILDGMESLQSSLFYERGKVKDPALAVLLSELADENKGLCIISTREEVADLADFPETTHQTNLEQISDTSGRALLRVNGVRGTDAELEETSRAFGNHALALNLLSAYLHDIPGHHISHAFEIPDIDVSIEKGKHPRRVMAAFAKRFGESPEVGVLRVLGLFDQPADADTIRAVRLEPSIDGVTEHIQDLPETGWRDLLEKLRECKLIAPRSTHNPYVLDAHPLIREHFGEELGESNPEGWKEAHRRLHKYYKLQHCKLRRDDPNNTTGIRKLLLMQFYHAHKAGCYKTAYEILYSEKIGELLIREVLYNWGQFGLLLSMTEELIKAFDDEMWNNASAEAKLNLLFTSGGVHRKQGNFGKAKELYQRAIDLARNISLKNHVSALLRMADVYYHMGDFNEEMNWLDQAAQLGRDLDNECKRDLDIEAVIAGRTGRILMARGLPSIAAGLNSQAIVYSEEANHIDHVCSETFERGDAYLLTEQLDLAFKDYEDALEMARKPEGRKDWEGEALRGLGDCYQEKGREYYDKAYKKYDEALRIAKETGYRWLEVKVYNATARMKLAEGKYNSAKEDAERALKIAREYGYMVEATNAHLIFARVVKHLGESVDEHVNKARELIDKTDHYWTKTELEEMRKFYVINNVIARVVAGSVTIEINNPEQIMDFVEVKASADAKWYSNQMLSLEQLCENRENGEIPLTSDSSKLRLGGGFLQIENTKNGKRIVVSKRHSTDQMRPGVLCESGGIHDRRDYILTMILELAEIARYEDDILYVPRLSRFFGYEREVPKLLKRYNEELEKEVIREAEGIGIKSRTIKYINVAMRPMASSVAVVYCDGLDRKLPIYGEVVAEADSSSLEFIGVAEYNMLELNVDNLRYQDTEREYGKPEGGRFREVLVLNLRRDWVQCWPEGTYPITDASGIKPDMISLMDALQTIDLSQTGGRYVNEKLCAILKKLPSLGFDFSPGNHFGPILENCVQNI